MAETIDLGNTETLSRGVFRQADGSWLAMTFTRSQAFKTERGARAWYAKATRAAPSPEVKEHARARARLLAAIRGVEKVLEAERSGELDPFDDKGRSWARATRRLLEVGNSPEVRGTTELAALRDEASARLYAEKPRADEAGALARREARDAERRELTQKIREANARRQREGGY